MNDPAKIRARASSTGRVTLDDVALRAGTSSITVSRAFRKPDLVSEDLRESIYKIANELGYVPNRAASSLASSRSMNIAVIIPSLSNSVFVDTINGIEKVLRPKGYQMLLGVSHYSSDEEDALLRTYMAFDPDGIILTGLNYRDDMRRRIERARIPVVHMMEVSNNASLYCVGFSQEAAAEAMTVHLLKQGYKRIAFVASQLDARTLARNRGYRDTLIRAGAYDSNRELLVPEPSSIGLGGVLLERMLQQAPDCDAIFFCNDDLAQGALFACQRMRIEVPSRLAIAGFNDLPASAHIVPSLTTVATPRFDVGVKSAQMLLGLIEGQKPARTSIDVGFELKPRQSA
jgi:LacI family gluconate utilization system Gnt-I transcriptional repressor